MVLSPKSSASENATGLSRDGLKPIMANSVMPTKDEEAELEAKSFNIDKTNEVKNTVEESESSENPQDSVFEQQEAKLESKEVAIAVPENKPMVSLPIHVVKKGDSLFAISKQYNIVMKSLQRWNKLRSPYILKIGDVLYLADPKSAANR